MIESDYFGTLQEVLHPALLDRKKSATNTFIIQEPKQKSFELGVNGLASHEAIKFGSINNWPSFATQHPFAHKLCDRVVIAWDQKLARPKYLLIELKSTNTSKAHKQLGATLAFCHFLHQMVCVGQISPPLPLFASVTVWDFPAALKGTSIPKLPEWNVQPLQPDCKHMHYPRSIGSMPVKAVLAKI